MLAEKLMGSGSSQTFVDDVFSAFTYRGNNSNQAITTGINLTGANKGMLWNKARSGAVGHAIFDTVRGTNPTNPYYLDSSSTAAQTSFTDVGFQFSSTGFVAGNAQASGFSAYDYIAYIFKAAPKFFDVQTFTVSGSSTTINHSLGVAPGFVIIKITNIADQWYCYHKDIGNNAYILLNAANAQVSSTGVFAATATQFTVTNAVATSPNSYVAYLFAHDTSTDGLIQCGSFTDSGSNLSVSLGWEPQYVLIKSSSPVSGAWMIFDDSRGMTSGGDDKRLTAETSDAETTADWISPTATGFNVNSTSFADSTYIYLAIRRPNKPPTTGTQVYNAVTRSGTGTNVSIGSIGFAPDLVFSQGRTNTGGSFGYGATGFGVYDRLRGPFRILNTAGTMAEDGQNNGLASFDVNGVSVQGDGGSASYMGGKINNGSITDYITHFFKRAPGVFDVVCFTGAASGSQTVSHSLAAVPELVITKCRSNAVDWYTYSATTGVNAFLKLNAADASSSFAGMWPSAPTSTTLSVNVDNIGVAASRTAVAYLFATRAGIQKITSFVGNGSSQTIDCGFTTGARFVCIKATSTTGDWLIGDSTRGLVAGNDPRLSLNTTAAEVTTEDWLDPASVGFVVNQVAGSNANVNGVTYLVWAIA